MEVAALQELLEEHIINPKGTWVDIGAGTGAFTVPLANIMRSGKLIAFDKSPHALWRLELPKHIDFEIMEGDFTQEMKLPLCDGIMVANALHYANQPGPVLRKLAHFLKPGGKLYLYEYDTNTARPPWVPYPLSFATFELIAVQSGLKSIRKLATVNSQYGHSPLYFAEAEKL